MFMSNVKCPGNREKCRGRNPQTNQRGQQLCRCAACPLRKEILLTKLNKQNEKIRKDF